jgi:hypothetical protein
MLIKHVASRRVTKRASWQVSGIAKGSIVIGLKIQELGAANDLSRIGSGDPLAREIIRA